MICKDFSAEVRDIDVPEPVFHEFGPGEKHHETLTKRWRVYGGLRFHGFSDAAATGFTKMVQKAVETVFTRNRTRTAESPLDMAYGGAELAFEQLYLRLDQAQIPQHVSARVILKIVQVPGSPDIGVEVTMVGAPDFKRTCYFADFPDPKLVREILMLA